MSAASVCSCQSALAAALARAPLSPGALAPAAGNARTVKYNLPLAQMHAPVAGPANPNDRAGVAAGLRNHWSGHAEDAHLNSFVFDEQYHTFHSYGYAADPGGSGATLHASVGKAAPASGSSVYTTVAPAKRQRTAAGGAKVAVGANYDPSAAAFTLTSRQPWAEKEAEEVELTEEQKECELRGPRRLRALRAGERAACLACLACLAWVCV